MSETRILVTGGAGYIGSHTAKALRAVGYEPVVLDDLSTGHRSSVKFGPLVEGKIEDIDLVARTIREFRINGVMHFAANAYVRESLIQPEKYFRNNIAHSVMFLETVIAAGVRKIVFSSSCAVYGTPGTQPISEDAPVDPINPYGETKLCIERVLQWYGKLAGVSSVSLRYFNAAGADPDGDLGELHDPEPHLIPSVLKAAFGHRSAIEVLGDDFPTPDGTAIRDYVHVTDIADAHVRALQKLANSTGVYVYNLGTGHGRSVREIIAGVERLTKRNVPIRIGSRSAGDPPCLVADARRAEADLRWVASHSNLEEILDSAFRWEIAKQRTSSVG